MPANIFAITPCKGRLEHLAVSLPALLGSGLSVVVVDYSCPDLSGDWVERAFPEAHVTRVAGHQRFNKSAAHNAGARAALACGADHFVFIDCDTVVTREFGAFCREHARLGKFWVFQPELPKKDLYGTLLISAADHVAANGYDESFWDWGMEDMEYRLRLRLREGLDYGLMPTKLASPISHSDYLRTRFYAEKRKDVSARKNFARVEKLVRRWTGKRLQSLPKSDVEELLLYPGR